MISPGGAEVPGVFTEGDVQLDGVDSTAPMFVCDIKQTVSEGGVIERGTALRSERGDVFTVQNIRPALQQTRVICILEKQRTG